MKRIIYKKFKIILYSKTMYKKVDCFENMENETSNP